MVMDCRYAIATAGLLSLHLCRLFQARLTPGDRSRSSLVTQSCFSSFEWMVLCSSARLPVSVTRDETVRRYFGSPRCGKAAGGHIRLALRGGLSDYCTGNPHPGARDDQFRNCNTQCFDRRCRGECVVGIFAPRVLIIFPNPLLPRASPLALSDF